MTHTVSPGCLLVTTMNTIVNASTRRSGTLSWCRCCRPTQGAHLTAPLRQPHPRVSAGRAFPPSQLPTRPNFSGPSGIFPGLPRYQKSCFKRVDNLRKVKRRRRSRVSSQKLAPNPEEKCKGEHCHLENKVRVSSVRRHTNILPRSPRPSDIRRHTNSCLDGTLPPRSLLRPPSLPPGGLASHPAPGSTRLSMAWALSQAKPKLLPPRARAVSPTKLSSVSTRPGLIPTRGRNPLKKNGAASIDKFKVCPPSPPAALGPTAFLPDLGRASTAQFRSLSSKAGETLLLLSAFPLPHKPGNLGLAGATQGSALIQIKFPFSRRQRQPQQTGCPPLGHCGHCPRNSPRHSFPNF